MKIANLYSGLGGETGEILDYLKKVFYTRGTGTDKGIY